MLNKRRDPESQTTLSLTYRTKSKRSRASAQIDESRLTISMLSECDRSPNMGESQSLAPAKPDLSNINSVRPPMDPAEVRSPQLPVREVTVVSCAA